jgi:NAD(P)-dependent dehydrogenase (short-subunit alcohol dehydrogenase family)
MDDRRIELAQAEPGQDQGRELRTMRASRLHGIRLVSNAGLLVTGPVDQFPADKWRTVIDVALFGYFLCVKHAACVMKAQRSGVIVQINSKSGRKKKCVRSTLTRYR